MRVLFSYGGYMARRRFFRRARSARRKLVWNHSVETDTTLGQTNGAVDILADFRTVMGITANLPGCTIARVRGAVQYLYDPLVAATSLSGLFIGMVVNEIGLASPRPLTNPNADWFYREWLPDAQPGQVIDPAAGAALASWQFDVKSMRKMQEVNQTIAFAWERTAVPNLNALTVVTSVLIMLP